MISANAQNIEVSGQAQLTISINNLRRDFTWTFIVAETVKPLLGYDFLNHFGILVDCGNNKLIDTLTNQTTNTTPTPIVMNIRVEQFFDQDVQDIIGKYPNLTSPHRNPNAKEPKTFHRIETGSNPSTFSKTRQLSAEKCDIAREEFKKLQQNGIISPSKSEWSSPLHMVTKSDGTYRCVGDYRRLNAITTPDRYQIPNINSLATKLHNKKFFTKIDLSSAYHQLPLHPKDSDKSAISTPFGLFQYNYMPFGLRNASSTFQRFMDSVFFDFNCVFVYIDDILVFSDDRDTHLKDLDSVLNQLNDYDLKISLSKCVFCVEELDFLGFNISKDGLKPSSKKLKELDEFPQPNDSKSLRRFLGMANFYRKLIPNFSEVIFPLTECIRINPNSKLLHFSEEEINSFSKIKTLLSSITPLSFPDPKQTTFQLVTDSSSYAVGAALHQMIDGEAVPIGFFSKKLSVAQRKYSTFDRELLAAYSAVLHFKHQIEGRNVLLLSDHKPLCSAFKSQTPLKSDRQQRHLSIITEYVSDICHIKGTENVVADCLSRPANSITIDVCDLQELVTHQQTDEEIKNFQENLKPFPVEENNSILCDVSLPYPRPFVTQKLRKSVFDSLHSLSHPGISASLKLIKARYYWPNMDKNIKTWCKECLPCQEAKINRHTKSEVNFFQLPSPRFQTVHIDIVGPLPQVTNLNDSSSSYRYLFTCIDRNTRWIECQPLSDISASSISSAFINIWISRFGVPLNVITDRGAQFESELFSELSKIIGFHRLRTCAYRPQTNGMIERAHRTLKTAIIARKESWLSALPIVLLGIRITPNETGYSPFTSVTGANAQIPQILIDNNSFNEETSNPMIKQLLKQMTNFDITNDADAFIHSFPKSYIPKDLFTCKQVWLRTDRVRKSLEAPYTGPYEVLERTDKHFTIKVNNKQTTVSVNRLKPAFLKDVSVTKSIEKPLPDNSREHFESETEQCSKTKTKSGRVVKWKKDNTYFYF